MAVAERLSRGRTIAMIIAVLLLQAAFIASYVGGLHGPGPHHVPVAVVAPLQQVDRLGAVLGPAADTVRLVSEPSVAAAQAAIRGRDVYGALVPSPGSTELLVASARGPAAATLLEQVFTPVAEAQGQQLQVRDVAPLPTGDPRGLTSFYLVIGWIVGAYLVAAIIGLYRGMTPAGPRDAAVRLGLLAAYAVVSGAVGVGIVQAGYGYLPGNSMAVLGIGALLVLAVALFTTALESVAGIIGTGIAILIFVVLGNPSAGGPWPIELTPGLWRSIGPWLPNGTATTAVRQAAYFSSHATAVPLLELVGYAVVGALGTVLMSRRRVPFIDVTGH